MGNLRVGGMRRQQGKFNMIISATVPSGTRSVSDPPLLLSQIFLDLELSVLLFGAVSSSVLRTQQVQPLIRCMTRFRTILHFFSEALF